MAITWTLNGAQIALAPDDLDGLDAFVQAHGPGVPSPVLEPAPTSAPTSPTPAPVPALSTWQVQIVDDDARKRIDAQHAVLTAAGYAVGTAHGQAFTNGTRMAAEGYAVQQGRAVEHAAKLPARDAIHALVTTIRAERREDIDTSAGELARAVEINGALKINGLKLREHAIRGLLTRLESPAMGYVLGLRDRIVARHDPADKALLAEIIRRELAAAPDVKVRLRTRGAIGDVFAVVSPSYTVADAPVSLARVADALPSDARATFAYDPDSTAWEVRASVWTPTPVALQAVGEPFEGFSSISGRDNGSGSVRGGGGANFLRCLNASTYSAEDELRRVHRGKNVEADIRAMVRHSTRAIETLCAAWGRARAEKIDARASLIAAGEKPDDVERLTYGQVMAAFFRATLTNRRSELAGVLPGQSSRHAANLASVYESERRDHVDLVRADVAQAWTKYIQDQPAPVRRDAERAAAAYVVG